MFYSSRVILLLMVSMILFFEINLSCKKEISCEGCRETNKPPIAISGPDQGITLPTDSASLDGTSSSDPDGKISEWLWTKISGPASFSIDSATAARTVVKNLSVGLYQFELKVTDIGGLSARDTVQVVVNDPVQPNRPPVAFAGLDQVIHLPANTADLDGSGCSDPDNNIMSYAWTKISGPLSFNIENANAIQTQVINLVEGVYHFELKVKDNSGLFSKDTIQVAVLAPITPCDNSDRPLVNARLIPFGTLSQARLGVVVASAGNKIVFAGAVLSAFDGSTIPDYGSSRVDIYDLFTKTWSAAELSEKRSDIAGVAAGNKIFFAGGRLGDGALDQLFSTVDIYDVTTDSWSVASLSEPRAYVAAATVGNKVFFAGGEKDWDYNTSDIVDIYDLPTGTWSTATLSEARAHTSAVATDNKIFFAGGHKEDRWYADPSNIIDIYDNVTGKWSVSNLVTHKGVVSAIAVNDNIYWANGCPVEIRNANSGSSSIAHLSEPGGIYSVGIDDKIIFLKNDYLVGTDKFDIYHTSSGTWSIGVLTQRIYGPSVISVNNTIYLAGGTVQGGFSSLSNQVWKLEF